MQKKQFTLIELLVVIAIIAVLATMLFPVVGNMKERALQTKCTSNLSQLGKAIMAYSMDNDNALPYEEDTKNGGGDKHAANLYVLRKTQVGEEPGLYLCPSSSRANNIGTSKDRDKLDETYSSSSKDFSAKNISYCYFTGGDLDGDSVTTTMKQSSGIMSDGFTVSGKADDITQWNHDTNGRWLRVDGSVQSKNSEYWPELVKGNPDMGKVDQDGKDLNEKGDRKAFDLSI